MSSADVAVRVFRKLENEDLRVLQVIESAMSRREFAPKEQIARFAKLSLTRDTDFRLTRLSKLGLIYGAKSSYAGYTLNYAGYDCLAINALVRGGTIEAFGKSLGVGKESDVYDALDPKGERIAVKFHRLGRISFRQTQRKRGYTKGRTAWIFEARAAAEKEFKALRVLYSHSVTVPKPIAENRHVIVMGIIEGGPLVQWQKIPKPKRVLREILRNVRKAYAKAGIIHADLSEYNIILKPDAHILIIDWPQYATKTHANAKELLVRDVKNIVNYFERKHILTTNAEEAVAYVSGLKKTVTL